VCVTCLANPGPATAGRLMVEADESRSRTLRMMEERHREWLAENAALPVPLPVCKLCDMPYGPKDGHPLLDQTCECCGGPIVEDLLFDFIFAKGRKARKRAAKRLRALAYA